jgi:hypothetical protein
MALAAITAMVSREMELSSIISSIARALSGIDRKSVV